jgi:hypothetical protein
MKIVHTFKVLIQSNSKETVLNDFDAKKIILLYYGKQLLTQILLLI